MPSFVILGYGSVRDDVIPTEAAKPWGVEAALSEVGGHQQRRQS